MPGIQPWCQQLNVDIKSLQKLEALLLEADLYLRVYDELKNIFRAHYEAFWSLFNLSKETQEMMLDENFLKLIITDILTTNEYSLAGIAHYSDTHEDVIHEIIDGRNVSPSAITHRRVMELHRLVKREVYDEILKKISKSIRRNLVR